MTNLNPLALIEKLINEHGSSTILKERLGLLKDQISALEKENAILKDNAKHLESKFNNAIKEIQRLNEIINDFQKNQGIKKYDEVTEKILKLFFEAGRDLSIYDFVRALSLSESKVHYHFDLLLEDRLITQTRAEFVSSWVRESSPALFELTPSGRKYVVENKIC